MQVSFLVDGFNLYHSVKVAQRRSNSLGMRWLDLRAMCETLMRSSLGPGHALQGVYYFSAFADHLSPKRPQVVQRHRTYRAAIEATGVHTSFSKFKGKDKSTPLGAFRVSVSPFARRWHLNTQRIRLEYRVHEEKETDVAIASKLFELLHRNVADKVFLVTGDTDLAPAIRTARMLFPEKAVHVAFPFERYNRGLATLASGSVKLDANAYQKHQLPDPVIGPRGHKLRKPAKW
jgi:uncharacterized LabA/DUF88 family protein